MLNEELFEEKRKSCGLLKGYLAEKLGISRPTFDKKCKGLADFTSTEIAILCREMKITSLREKELIFFTAKV